MNISDHIHHIESSGSLIEFPGEIAITLVYSGCNLRCRFCHNAKLLAKMQSNISDESLYVALESWREKFGTGIVISGGEPLVHETSIDLIRAIRKDFPGFAIKLDTNGSFPFRLLELIPILETRDFIAMDIKTSLKNYESLTGGLIAEEILNSIHILTEKMKCKVLFRSTIVESLHSVDVFKEMITLIPKSYKYLLQAFKPSQAVLSTEFQNYPETSEKYLQKLMEYAKDNGYKKVCLK